jgi:hypothetical protein
MSFLSGQKAQYVLLTMKVYISLPTVRIFLQGGPDFNENIPREVLFQIPVLTPAVLKFVDVLLSYYT